jgi:hypothetical protein
MKPPPPSVVASWPAPNYINPEVHDDSVIIINSVFSFIVAVFLGIRLYARFCVTKWYGVDDFLIIASVVSKTAFMGR